MEKTIITIVGKDTTGIIAKTTTYLYEHNVNILEINQTIVGGIFNMMMIVDTANLDIDFLELGGLLGTAPIMEVNPFGCREFISRTGGIPAPIHSFKN